MSYHNREDFLKYAKEIKDLGYKVYVNDVSNDYSFGNYGYIVNDKDEIGYFQLGEFWGVQFSTKHKPNGEFGCGFGLDTWDKPQVSPLTREIVDRVFMHHPSWARPSNKIHTIKKWTATEFFNDKSVYGAGNRVVEL